MGENRSVQEKNKENGASPSFPARGQEGTRSFRKCFDPVWLLFVPPLIARAFLLMRISTNAETPATGDIAIAYFLLLLLLVVLTWYVAGELAIRARLSERGTERFMVMSALGALAPPFVVALAESFWELNFIASLVVLLWLILAALRLIRRWSSETAVSEMGYHWLEVGLPCGLTLWLQPSLFPGLILILLCLYVCLIRSKPGGLRIVASIMLVPSIGIGYIPALYWPIRDNHSDHVTSLLMNAWNNPPILSGTLLFVFTIVLIALLVAAGSWVLGIWWYHPILRRLRLLVGLPLFFAGSTLGMCGILSMMLSKADFWNGGFGALVATGPFFNAALFALPYMITQYRNEVAQEEGKSEKKNKGNKFVLLHMFVLALIGLYFISQIYDYIGAHWK
jgi:hypothetical protein